MMARRKIIWGSIIAIILLAACILWLLLAYPAEPDPTPLPGSPTPSATWTATVQAPTREPEPTTTPTQPPATVTESSSATPTFTPIVTATPELTDIPLPTETPVLTPISPQFPLIYIVKWHDNLSMISYGFYGYQDWRCLHRANPWIRDPNIIFAEWEIVIPAPC